MTKKGEDVIAISIILTMIIVLIGVILLVVSPKATGSVTATPTPPPTTNGSSDDPKMRDEIKSPWQSWGLIDDTPNIIRAIVRGNEEKGPIIEYIFPGERFSLETESWEPYIETDPFKEFILRTFGKRVFGIPLITNIRPLGIDRVVEKDTQGSQLAALSLTDQLNAKSVRRYGLYRKFPRPTLLKNLDMADGVRFSVISYTNIEVTDPRPAFEVYKDNFLQTISGIISTFLSKNIIGGKWEEYKRDANVSGRFNLDELNKLLIPIGVKVTQLEMSDPELHPAIQADLELEKRAEEKRKARIKDAEGEKSYKTIVAEGEAVAIERIAKAKAKRFEELIKLYTEKEGYSRRTAVDKANEMIRAEFDAEARGKLTVYAPGMPGVIPLGGEKKIDVEKS